MLPKILPKKCIYRGNFWCLDLYFTYKLLSCLTNALQKICLRSEELSAKCAAQSWVKSEVVYSLVYFICRNDHVSDAASGSPSVVCGVQTTVVCPYHPLVLPGPGSQLALHIIVITLQHLKQLQKLQSLQRLHQEHRGNVNVRFVNVYTVRNH